MKSIFLVLLVGYLLVIISDKHYQVECLSCELGRFGCVHSCQYQNCATGYCNSKKVCICSRCGKGFQQWKAPQLPQLPQLKKTKPK